MKNASLTALSIGALGIVFGDIGTSPLYAFNEIFSDHTVLAPTPEHALGAASLIFWILLIVIGIKYAVFVLRADDAGEGGTLALFSLLKHPANAPASLLALLLMFAAGLLFGEGIITPAISVLSAVEGLRVALPSLEPLIVPITLLLLVGIFFFQHYGSRHIGQVYGPIMFLWFFTIALLGIIALSTHPTFLLSALNPIVALSFITELPLSALLFVLGAAFLSVTGGEALYADLGHLGKKAVRLSWFLIVFPALFLNYAGQGAYVASGAPIIHGNIFYSLVPDPFLYPMILLATLATIIASVALIFGAYSLASQAIAMSILPRLRIIYTSQEKEGQIYIPAINWMLFAGSALLVILFQTSGNLAAAYGFSVSGVMLVTSLTLIVLSQKLWGWSRWLSVSIFGSLALLDAVFFFANSLKFFEGGFIPFFLGCGIFLTIATWRWGRRIIRLAYDAYASKHDIRWFLDLKRRVTQSGGIIADERARHIVELDRAVVFLISRPVTGPSSAIPVKLRVYLKRRGAIPRNTILLNISQERVPFLRHHYDIIDLGQGVFAVQARFGFMQNPTVSRVIHELYRLNIFDKKFRRCSIEASEDEFIIDAGLPLPIWFRAVFFKQLLRFSVPRYRYFGLLDEASAGLSKTVVPIRLNREGIRIEIPEFPFKENEEGIDPDTLKPTTLPFTPLPS